jgi:DNA helicase-2/ATP-dependent DNA helicase PcrA
MIYLPLHPAFGARFPSTWGDVFVDEVQDLCPTQVELVWRLGGPKARYCFVGDRHQAIYGWRGAGTEMVDYITERFACRELPLSVCWRCGTSIVAEAQAYSPTLQPAPGAPAGEVIRVPADQDRAVPDGVLVLCRTSAPLVRRCMALLAAGRRATVKGKDIGRSLAAVVRAAVRRSKAATIAEALEAVHDDITEAVAKASAEGHDVRAANLADREAAIRAIAERQPGAAKPAELIRAIEDLFSDLARAPSGGVLFSTIHKAKGAEAPEVWWMDPGRTCLSAAHRAAPLDDAAEPWQAVQEQNCKYVACTRARARLVMLGEESLQA